MNIDNYKERTITFPRGQFTSICQQLSEQYGPKGEGWDNVFCMPSGDTETMKIRYKLSEYEFSTISHWDAFEMIPAGSLEEFIELEGNKQEYLLEDVKTFIKIYNS